MTIVGWTYAAASEFELASVTAMGISSLWVKFGCGRTFGVPPQGGFFEVPGLGLRPASVRIISAVLVITFRQTGNA